MILDKYNYSLLSSPTLFSTLMEKFTNEPIEISGLPRYEDVVLDPLHASYWKVIVLNICITLLTITIAVTLLFYLSKESQAYILPVVLGIIFFGTVLILIFRLSFKRRGLAVRDKDIIYSSGILSSKTTIVPFSRIQHVALNQGIFSRMYKLAALQVFTAGGASGNITIHGLPLEKANKIKELLAKRLDNGTT
jgi:membrane protein YdbS with pleckstrin-like domain